MKKFTYLPHTADIRIYAEGDTLTELFEAALEGLCGVLTKNLDNIDQNHTFNGTLRVESIDLTSLLIDFLSVSLSLMETEKAIFNKVIFTRFDENKIIAEMEGYPIDRFGIDVKAVTYHEAEIITNESNVYSTNIILDI
jgi:SHS2 domain-containing protein